MSDRKRKADDDSIIYFLIICHGTYIFNDGNPEYVKIPQNMNYVNKITYTPFGYKNILPNAVDVKETIISICNDTCPTNNFIPPDVLIPLLKNDVELLEEQRKNYNIRQQFKDLHNTEPECNFKMRCCYKMLFNKSNLCYQNVIYSNTQPKNNIPIIQKTFQILSTDENKDLNIYVVYQNNGKLNQGDTILNSRIYRSFLTYKDLYDTGTITTQQLLELAKFYMYENVVIIDYSCDTCKENNGDIVSRDLVMSIRELISSNQIGRGYRKRRKTKKNRVLRKYKKTTTRRKNKQKEKK